jgi:D-glycero-D-manno-heptose 1,7-bisphosphate phosphatase
VLNRRVVDGYVTKPAELELIGLALNAAVAAQKLGAALIVVTNQGSIGRRCATEADILRVHACLLESLSAQGIFLDGIYTCPHHPRSIDPAQRDCLCRKPKPGMIFAAASDLNLDLGESILIGDQPSDVSAALAAGISEDRALLVGEDSGTAPLDLVRSAWGGASLQNAATPCT